jgi:hypothetical protein
VSAGNGKESGPNGAAKAAKLSALPDSDQRLLRKCALDLVGLIQNPTNLRAVVTGKSFEDRLVKLGLSEAEAKKRVSLILSALPQTEALLAPVGDSTTRFRWQYDIHGFAVASKASFDDAKAAVAQFQALERVDAELQRLFAVGIATLEARFQLFQASIKWPDVGQLARQLAAASGIGEAAQETLDGTLKLKEYCTALHGALPRFVHAILIAHLLAPKRPFTESLPCVTEGLELSLLPDEQRGERLSATLAELLALTGYLYPAPLSQLASYAPPVAGSEDRWLLPALQVINGPDLPRQDWSPQFFEVWRLRLTLRLGGAADPGPRAANVAMLLLAKGKSLLINRAWSRNTAASWSEILVSGFTQRTASDGLVYPRWCAPYALAQLGLVQSALELDGSFLDGELGGALAQRRDAGRRRLVVLVAAEPSPLELPTWLLSTTYAALVLTRSQLTALGELMTRIFGGSLAQEPWLLVEGTEREGFRPPEALLEGELHPLWHDLFPPSRRVQLFAREPGKGGLLSQAAQAVKAPPRYFVGAHSIDEAVNKADALVTQSAS